jgi:hypothetical protein
MVAVTLAAACRGQAPAVKEPDPSRSGGAREAGTGAMATRREAQDNFDRARAAFIGRRFAEASRELNRAALFLREQADSAAAVPRARLLKSARELEALADNVHDGLIDSPLYLDYAFARAQLADAENHHQRALMAWVRRDNACVGDELLMAVDHVERAAQDGRVPIGPDTRVVLDSARWVATRLCSGIDWRPEVVGRVSDQLGAQIHGLSLVLRRRTVSP